MTTSSTTAATPGIGSSRSPGPSCLSGCATGRMGSDQRDSVLVARLPLQDLFKAPVYLGCESEVRATIVDGAYRHRVSTGPPQCRGCAGTPLAGSAWRRRSAARRRATWPSAVPCASPLSPVAEVELQRVA